MNKDNFKNFTPSQPTGERMTLPAGLYDAHIIAARVDDPEDKPCLLIQVEIDSGDYKDFYHKLYEAQQGGQYPAKYKGVFRVLLPDGRDEEHDAWRQKALEWAVWAIEQSNRGYHWDWDESRLKGLKIGLNVREREYYYNKRFGVHTEIGRLESLAAMHDPDESKWPKVMKKRLLSERDRKQKEQDEANASGGYVEVDSEELPW